MTRLDAAHRAIRECRDLADALCEALTGAEAAAAAQAEELDHARALLKRHDAEPA